MTALDADALAALGRTYRRVLDQRGCHQSWRTLWARWPERRYRIEGSGWSLNTLTSKGQALSYAAALHEADPDARIRVVEHLDHAGRTVWNSTKDTTNE